MDDTNDVDENSQNDSESEDGAPYDHQQDHEESSAENHHAISKSRSSIADSQESAARRGDPNHGCCLLTREQLAVHACHLLPRAVKSRQLDQLEWAWGMKYHSLNVGTSSNLLFLRLDWHICFDEDNWFLIPDAVIVNNIYDRIGECENQEHQPTDIKQLYNAPQVFEYHFVATKELKDKVLFRHRDPDEIHATNVIPSIPAYAYHEYPFKSLGVLKSHVQPHFVLINAGKKLDKMERLLPLALSAAETLGTDTLTLLTQIIEIYRVWTRIQVPSEFRQFSGHSGRRPPSKDERDSDGESPSERWRRPAKRSRKSRPDGKKPREGASVPPRVGYRMLLPVTDDPRRLEEDDMSIDSYTSPMQGQHSTYRDGSDCVLDESLLSWVEKCSQMATNEGGWEASVFNDEQIGHYRAERARVPRKESWRTWRAPWIRRNYDTHPPPTHKFSSNDWAVYHECSYLTD